MDRALICSLTRMYTLDHIKMDYHTAKMAFINGLLVQYTKATSFKEEKKEEDNGKSS